LDSLQQELTDFENNQTQSVLIEEPGFGESLIPIWGPGKSSVHHFQKGEYGWGATYAVLAVSDVFLVKAVLTSLSRAGLKLVFGSGSSKHLFSPGTMNVVSGKVATQQQPHFAWKLGQQWYHASPKLMEDGVKRLVINTWRPSSGWLANVTNYGKWPVVSRVLATSTQGDVATTCLTDVVHAFNTGNHKLPALIIWIVGSRVVVESAENTANQ
jgi:hypothetical protein